MIATMARIEFSDGSYYIGDVYTNDEEQMMHGHGTLFFVNGAIARGEFVYDHINGYCETDYSKVPETDGNTRVYEKGTFKNDILVDGMIEYKDGRKIIGKFNDEGKPIGEFKYIYDTGSYFFTNLKSVDGIIKLVIDPHKRYKIYRSDDSVKYDGYLNDKAEYHGEGIFYPEKGGYIVGTFKNGFLHGHASRFMPIGSSKELFLEFTGEFEKANIVKGHICFEGKAISKDAEVDDYLGACFVAVQPKVEEFLALPDVVNEYTHDYALMVKIIKRLFANQIDIKETLISYLSILFTFYAYFDGRLVYQGDAISCDLKKNTKEDILWDCLFIKARSYAYDKLKEACGSEKEMKRVIIQVFSDDQCVKYFIPCKKPNGELFDLRRKQEVKEEIKQKQKPKKSEYVYEFNFFKYDYLQKHESKGLDIKLNFWKRSRVVVGIGKCQDTDLVIPSITKHKIFYGVKRIAEDAFKNNKRITSVFIPSTIRVERHAFYNCENLRRINLGDWAIIDDKAFENLVNLEDIVYCSTKERWWSFYGSQLWLTNFHSKNRIIIHCKDGDLLL